MRTWTYTFRIKPTSRMECFSLPHFLVWFRLREEMPPVRACESLVPPGSASLGPARTLPPCVPILIFLAPLGCLLWLPSSLPDLLALSGQKSQSACDWDNRPLQGAFL